VLFVRYGFSRERDDKPYLKFYMKNVVLFIYRMILKMFAYSWTMTDFGASGSGQCLGASVALRVAHSTYTLQVWYLSIDRHFFLIHVEFEDGLSISVLKNWATCHKDLQLES
jgi:hypothetical protein